jgi:tRNA nucleotidyltransferase (CCA-adding enzyme)
LQGNDVLREIIGMKTYLVGGAVRDRLLGLPVSERDWVVVGGTEQEMLKAGFRRLDRDFPVFLHPVTGEEYALARTERKTGPGYKGFTVVTGPEVSLEQDLVRRDLTINALAEAEDGRLIDLLHGQEDLEARQLRHIGPAFEEDPVRILRVARFAARLGHLGFTVAPETLQLMTEMSATEELRALKPERIWQEMRKALGEAQPWRFFEVLYACGALEVLIPALHSAMDQGQGESAGVVASPLDALRNATALSEDLTVRFAALMYGVVRDARGVKALCMRLRAERDCCELLDRMTRLAPQFATAAGADADVLLDLLERSRAFQHEGGFQRFLDAGAALWPKEAPGATRWLKQALAAAREVDAASLAKEGFSGPALGAELARRRICAIRNSEGEG